MTNDMLKGLDSFIKLGLFCICAVPVLVIAIILILVFK